LESEYDRLTRRSVEAKQRLDRAERLYQDAVNGIDGTVWIARRRREVALRKYLEIEAERKRAAPPPPPAAD
jgi:hypothetical protein